MKINNVGTSGLNPYQNNVNKAQQVKNATVRSKDKVEISTTAKELQHSSQLVAQRQTKVEAIKLSLDNGTYSVDLNETAKSIINFYSKK